ncbi:MAG: cell division protein FtsA [Candidatus Egerieousia sp.]
MRNYIAAVDLGTTKVVCAVGEKTANGVKIIAYSEVPSKGIKRGRVENVKLAHQSLSMAIRNVEKELDLKINEVFVGIAGQDIKCISPEPTQIMRDNPSELITLQEISAITNRMYSIPLEDGYKVIQSIPQSFNVDNYMAVSEPVGMIGRSILSRYKLFVGKDNSGKLIQSTLNLSGVKQIEQLLEPVASAKAVLTDDEKELGCALVDIGGGTTDVVIIQNNIVRHAGIIPFGGNSITEDICIGCGITQSQAETAKKNHGCCFSDYADADKTLVIPGIERKDREIPLKVLAKIIQARMEEIFEAVCWHIEQSGYKNSLRGGIVLTGGGSRIKNITNLANVVTGYEARTACPTAYTIDGSSVEGAKSATAATAVGLIINAFDKMADEGITYNNSVIPFGAEVENEVKGAEETISVLAGVEEEPKKAKAKPKERNRISIGKKIGQLFGGEGLFSDQNADEA